VQIVSALFTENFNLRQVPGPASRIDLTGVMFSMAAPSPAPVTVEAHLVAIIYCPLDHPGSGIFEVVVRRGPLESDDEMSRNVSPFNVEPGRFTYRLVRAEMDFPDYGQVFAHCRVDRGPWMLVPFTLLAPV